MKFYAYSPIHAEKFGSELQTDSPVMTSLPTHSILSFEIGVTKMRMWLAVSMRMRMALFGLAPVSGYVR